ncbi:HAMP domain-containing sensor histidine kinase [Thermoflavimicrobium dichotomicum]|uniref:Heme sensor protein HssS n=1 Tax=Thermoflavimicrobium dichotomicum TaxID=46223 RepID=A0A1I3K4U7_9BACL|nr:HAMP domain-containing sensor histidine kinase [Thermoflavimicrobium dichotomicum]SFI67531.1 Signal transduction histidine kinase [Thermoflavimicrobium dichotomicum]
MKTLYTRIVIVYIGTVIVSIIAGLVTIYLLLESKYGDEQEQYLIKQGQSFIALYEKRSLKEMESIMDLLHKSMFVNFRLYDSSGLLKTFGENLHKDEQISPQKVEQVIKGNVYREDARDRFHPIVGLPFQKENKRYALFVYTSDESALEKGFIQIVYLGFFCVLLTGSLLIAVASQYIIKPLKNMTKVTKQLAKGNFDVKLNLTRKDEIGELARSFESMAQDLKKMEQMRKEFISDVSHEIQSPLTSIRGFSKVLKHKNLSQEERWEYLDIIESESERLSKLTENLLRLSSLESDHHPFEPETFWLDEQIRDVILYTESEWTQKKIEVEVDLAKQRIEADKELLKQVWINLIHNSIKYTPEGGRIRVRLVKWVRQVNVCIEDTGIGIAEEDQKRIFDRFYKVDKSRSRKSGSGIGLAIVKKIVEIHRGEIHVKSKPGQGSTFIVTLPLKQSRRKYLK